MTTVGCALVAPRIFMYADVYCVYGLCMCAWHDALVRRAECFESRQLKGII